MAGKMCLHLGKRSPSLAGGVLGRAAGLAGLVALLLSENSWGATSPTWVSLRRTWVYNLKYCKPPGIRLMLWVLTDFQMR